MDTLFPIPEKAQKQLEGLDRDYQPDPAPTTPVARNTDPPTSHLAARDAAPRAGTNRALVLVTLRGALAGLTDYELAALTGLQQNSAGKRRGELRDAGYVRNTGRTRPAPSKSKAIVWELTSLGREIAARYP